MLTADLDLLVGRSRQGDMAAFGDLVKSLHAEVCGQAALLGVAADSIDDVAQEVFIEVYRALARYQADFPFSAWVRGFTRNVVLRHGQRKSRELRLRTDALSAYLRERELAARPDAAEPALEGTLLDGLRRCLDGLPEHLRTLVMLRYADGKSSGDIAAELRRSAEGVRMALMRVRESLLRCVEARQAGGAVG